MKASKHPFYFYSIKLAQAFLCLIIIILEITSYVAWSNYVDSIQSSRLYPDYKFEKSMYFEKTPFRINNNRIVTYDGQVKIWYYIVIVISSLGSIVYIFKSRWMWNHALRLILTELFLFALWFSAGLANLSPWLTKPGLNCSAVNSNSTNPIIIRLAELAVLQCNTYVASLSFGWINVGLYICSLLIARKRSSELDWTNEPNFNNNNNDQEVGENVDSGRASYFRGLRKSSNRPAFF